MFKMTDEQLVALAKSSHSEAVGELYERYFDAIYRYFYFQVNFSRETAEDLTQDTFMDMAKSVTRFRGESSFKNWLYTLAKYKLNSHLKQKYSLPTVSLFESLADKEVWIDPVEQTHKITLLDNLLNTLKPKEKKLIILRYLRGFSVKEAANKLSLTESNVKVMCLRSLKKLQKTVT
jgi:RNA polymerase sigma-70 factor (ECF subfamily)